MTISAKIITDSTSPQGIRLPTFEVVCHRFILPEVNTHRVFSRNWASSRAIPTKKLIEMVRTNPAVPLHWGKNQAGMQAYEELADAYKVSAQSCWQRAAEAAADHAEFMLNLGAHKQIVNRVLEPFLWVRGVITATEWANFYALRRHEDAQPEIKALADAMWDAQQASEPKKLNPGDWHVPYYEDGIWEAYATHHPDPYDINGVTLQDALKISTARCARVSYLTHDGRPTTIEEDIALYEKLVVSQPLHASPAEHQATPDFVEAGNPDVLGSWTWSNPSAHGNLHGWIQHRKTLPNEFVAG